MRLASHRKTSCIVSLVCHCCSSEHLIVIIILCVRTNFNYHALPLWQWLQSVKKQTSSPPLANNMSFSYNNIVGKVHVGTHILELVSLGWAQQYEYNNNNMGPDEKTLSRRPHYSTSTRVCDCARDEMTGNQPTNKRNANAQLARACVRGVRRRRCRRHESREHKNHSVLLHAICVCLAHTRLRYVCMYLCARLRTMLPDASPGRWQRSAKNLSQLNEMKKLYSQPASQPARARARRTSISHCVSVFFSTRLQRLQRFGSFPPPKPFVTHKQQQYARAGWLARPAHHSPRKKG